MALADPEPDLELHPLVDGSANGDAAPRRRRLALALAVASASLGVMAAAALLSRAHSPAAAHVAAPATAVSLAAASQPQCGAVASPEIVSLTPTVGGSKLAMESAGWKFEHSACEDKFDEFRPALQNPQGDQVNQVPKTSYYGWCWPGKLKLAIQLKGSGTLYFNGGNANSDGYVTIRVGQQVMKFEKPEVIYAQATLPFVDGDVFSVEEDGNAIMVMNTFQITCNAQAGALAAPLAAQAALAPGFPPLKAIVPLPDRSSTWGTKQFLDMMEFTYTSPDQWPCDTCLGEQVEGIAWGNGGPEQISARTWCASVCRENKDCAGILYPLATDLPCHVLLKTCGTTVCDPNAAVGDRKGWDFLRLTDRSPHDKDVPQVNRDSM
eukprot:TRINITY_DN63177_c0_g1_i1.p1 TRINITY_DN63177_c0_g1~~TRINITY_DN63177_c0_g1_i1.p1  ORF type:complete len:406 (-),score=81.90 TRINITY_DN63177_c0_g1_i1:237-1376(-)